MNPGWYTDPTGMWTHRYFDGTNWTEHVNGSREQSKDQDTAPVYIQSNGQYPMSTPVTRTQTYFPSMQYSSVPVARKEPALSVLCSFFLPGLGSFVNGDAGTGIVILVSFLLSLLLWLLLIGILLTPMVWIWGMFNAYRGAQRWNMAHGLPL